MNWILDKIKGLFAKKYVASIVRTLLAVAAGSLLSMGLPKEAIDQFTQAADPVLTGAALYFVTQILSWLDKKRNQN